LAFWINIIAFPDHVLTKETVSISFNRNSGNEKFGQFRSQLISYYSEWVSLHKFWQIIIGEG